MSFFRKTESDIEIKLEWNNIDIVSTKGMFYNCIDITEIDMTKFDTSLVDDMSEMFSLCSSLNSVKVSNLDTSKVETFENMFFQCSSLTYINLESFTNSAAISLKKMFYGFRNLEYINIKNFVEKANLNLEEMFYNIPTNAVICLLSCPPPTHFTVNEMTSTRANITWEGYEWNKFILSYGLQNLINPEDGVKINVIDKNYYILTKSNSILKYYFYIKTECGSKSSYWIGPLLIDFEPYNIGYRSSDSIRICAKIIYDSGGQKYNYRDEDSSTLVIFFKKCILKNLFSY